jgi:hypothetical protein
MTEAGQQRGVATHAWRLWTPEEAIEAVKDLVAAGLKKAGLRMCCERAAGLVEVLATEMDVFLAVRRRLWRAEARDICELVMVFGCESTAEHNDASSNALSAAPRSAPPFSKRLPEIMPS